MLAYRLEGRGSPLLLIHGWGVTYNVWKNLVPLLAPYFQLILVELPWLGASEEMEPDRPYYEFCAEALEELREALEIEQWRILAYSTGTRAGEAYVQRYPQYVTRAVFLCPLYLHKSWTMALQMEEWIDSRRSDMADWFLSGWRLHGLLLTLGFNFRKSDYSDEWMDEIEMLPLEHLKRMLLELPGKGRAPFSLPATPSVPILFVWGRRDALIARPLRSRPNDVFILANHGAPMMVPDQIAEIVLPFFQNELETEPGKYRHTLLRTAFGKSALLTKYRALAIRRLRKRTMVYPFEIDPPMDNMM
ncbi:MAG TPA: alpha/beta hydrolase [Ktedonobacteraceae bacterium]